MAAMQCIRYPLRLLSQLFSRGRHTSPPHFEYDEQPPPMRGMRAAVMKMQLLEEKQKKFEEAEKARYHAWLVTRREKSIDRRTRDARNKSHREKGRVYWIRYVERSYFDAGLSTIDEVEDF